MKKETNPKDALGIGKVPLSTVPAPVLMQLGLAMLEGARKYGRHNYRITGVKASVYYDAHNRHKMAWWEGEDIDADSMLSHIVKGMACDTILLDAIINGTLIDDRPPKSKSGWVQELNQKAKEIIEKYPNSVPPFTQLEQSSSTTIDADTDSSPESREQSTDQSSALQ